MPFNAQVVIAEQDRETLRNQAALHSISSTEPGFAWVDETGAAYFITFTSEDRGRLAAFLWLFIFDGDSDAVDRAIAGATD